MLGLIVPALASALAVTLLQHGRHGDRTPLRWSGLAVVALGVQLILFNPPIDGQPWALAWGRGIYIASMLCVLAVLVRNGLGRRMAHIPWLLAAAGIGLNILVILANGGFMPQSRDALRSTGGTPRPENRLTNVAPLTEHTRLPWLGDVIPEPDWLPMTNVVSAGDLLLAAGTAWALAARAPKRRAGPRV
jgi:Family of unknown function (DUF5317)